MSLDQSILNAKIRPAGGKGHARRLRMSGLVPAVIYGRGSEPVSLSLEPAALKKAIATPHKFNTVITVKLDGAGEKLALLKDYQQHPVTRALLHADFQEVRLDQEVTVSVPVVLTGKAQGVVDGGILSQVSRLLEITCLPRAIPEALQVDVTPLKIGGSIHASDIVLPAGITLTNKIATIATMSVPEAEAVVAPVAGAAAPAAGAAAAPAAAGKPGAAAPAAAGKPGAAAPAAAAKAPAKK